MSIFVTHDQTEALALADRIAVMDKGRLQQYRTGGDLVDRPPTPTSPPSSARATNIFVTRTSRGDGAHRGQIEPPNGMTAATLTSPKAAPANLQDGRKLALGIRPPPDTAAGEPNLGTAKLSMTASGRRIPQHEQR